VSRWSSRDCGDDEQHRPLWNCRGPVEEPADCANIHEPSPCSTRLTLGQRDFRADGSRRGPSHARATALSNVPGHGAIEVHVLTSSLTMIVPGFHDSPNLVAEPGRVITPFARSAWTAERWPRAVRPSSCRRCKRPAQRARDRTSSANWMLLHKRGTDLPGVAANGEIDGYS